MPRNRPTTIHKVELGQQASMRPRQACLGIAKTKKITGRESPASMRPRQACLGISAATQGLDRGLKASMRPRQACLGIPSRRRPDPSRDHRFNEAEASLPRNRRTVAQRRLRANRFNEAEASLPRNRLTTNAGASMKSCFNEAEASLPRNPVVSSVVDTSDAASMRPRQACLGIDDVYFPVTVGMDRLQ